MTSAPGASHGGTRGVITKKAVEVDQIPIPEEDAEGNPIVMAWISVKNGWHEPIDLDDVQSEVNLLRARGLEFEIFWIADKPTYARYDRIRNKDIIP